MSTAPPDWLVEADATARAKLVAAFGAEGAAGLEAAVSSHVYCLYVVRKPPFTLVGDSGSPESYVGAGSLWIRLTGDAGFAALIHQVAHLDPVENVALIEQACRLAGIDIVREVDMLRAICGPVAGDEMPPFEPPHRVGRDFTFVGLVRTTSTPRRPCQITVRGETGAVDVEPLPDALTGEDLERALTRVEANRRNPPVSTIKALIEDRIRADGAVTAAEPVVVSIRAEHDNEGCEYRAVVAWFNDDGKIARRTVEASTVNGFAAGLTDGPNAPPWWARLQVGDRFVQR